jgi:hypothetical protein
VSIFQAPYVFISHSSEDNDVTRKITEYLQYQGIEAWLDLQQLKGGKRWVRELEEALEGASLVCVLMSRRARESEWVERETVYALEHKKPIVIARLDNTPLPLQLVTRQSTDFRGGLGRDFMSKAATLMAEVQPYLRQPTPSPDEVSAQTLPPEQAPTANEDNFFAYIAQMPDGDHMANIARDLYGWAQIYAEKVDFGGKHTPCFHVRIMREGKAVTVFSLLAYMVTPSLQVPLDYLTRYVPYEDEKARANILAQLNACLPEGEKPFAVDRARPTLALATLDSQALERFKDIAANIINTLSA